MCLLQQLVGHSIHATKEAGADQETLGPMKQNASGGSAGAASAVGAGAGPTLVTASCCGKGTASHRKE